MPARIGAPTVDVSRLPAEPAQATQQPAPGLSSSSSDPSRPEPTPRPPRVPPPDLVAEGQLPAILSIPDARLDLDAAVAAASLELQAERRTKTALQHAISFVRQQLDGDRHEATKSGEQLQLAARAFNRVNLLLAKHVYWCRTWRHVARQCCWARWHSYVSRAQQSRQLVSKLQHRTVFRSIMAWHRYCADVIAKRTRRQALARRIIGRMTNMCLGNSLNAWIQLHKDLVRRRVMLGRALRRMVRRTEAVAMTAWHVYLRQARVYRRVVVHCSQRTVARSFRS